MEVTGVPAPPTAKAPPSNRVRVLPSALAESDRGRRSRRTPRLGGEGAGRERDRRRRGIDVEIDGGGRRLVRVVDDGSGMVPDDARLALRRHATSKLTSADDLWGLRTFGFRGEALPSIAAVSRLTLTTRPPRPTPAFA